MRRLAVRALLLLIAGILTAGAAAWWAWSEFTAPGPLVQEKTLIVSKGAGIRAVAGQLEDTGVIDSATIFILGSRYLELGRRFRAGEFAFAPGMSMRAVAHHLVSGPMVLRRLTVPEGLLSVEVVRLIEEADGLTGPVADTPPDGALLPETYFYSYGDSRESLVRRMAEAMDEALHRAWEGRSERLAVSTPAEALILAAMIERETGVPAERGRIAAVFHNRLKRGMRLQSDPTVAYSVTGGKRVLDRPLTVADLRIASPFNTYEQAGLPPGAIANPGRAAIEAAVNPVDSRELYFVADGSGGHAFAETLREHNRNVAKWRRILRQRNGN